MLSRDLVLIAFIALGMWAWWSAARGRETAVAFARSACRRCQVQLLDETVSLCKIRLQRNTRGHMGLARWYSFEFSTNGHDRRAGVVGVLGAKLTDMHLDLDVEELRH